jgi:hypothetical protein
VHSRLYDAFRLLALRICCTHPHSCCWLICVQAGIGVGKARFALSAALRSLGLPCMLPVGLIGQSVEPMDAAKALDQAFARKTTVRRHMCPLNWAGTLPPLRFGRAALIRRTAASSDRTSLGARPEMYRGGFLRGGDRSLNG